MPLQNGDAKLPQDLEADAEKHPNGAPMDSGGTGGIGRTEGVYVGPQTREGTGMFDHPNDAVETRGAESVDFPPGKDEAIPLSKTYAPLSFPVIALLMPASVFGVLARLGLVALMTYDGESVFPLAYAQAVGCLIMGMALRLKEPIGEK